MWLGLWTVWRSARPFCERSTSASLAPHPSPTCPPLPPLQPPTDNGTTEGGRYGDYRQAGEAFNQLECAIVGPLAAEEQGGEERRRAADGFPRAAYINEPSAASSRSGAADEQTRMLC